MVDQEVRVVRSDDDTRDVEQDGDDRQGRHPDLGAYIRSQREQAKLSLRKLSSLAGVSNPYLSQIERGLRNPSAEILQAIARGLEISSETLYVQAGILDPDHDERSDVETVLSRARELTESQRATLLEMYRSFRRLAAFEVDGAEPGRAAEVPPIATDPEVSSDVQPHEPDHKPGQKPARKPARKPDRNT